MKLLELKSIKMNFGAIQALQEVNLHIAPGEALGLMGDNGAGKSTLMKIIAGNFAPTAGEIFLEGKKVICVPVCFAFPTTFNGAFASPF